jgi:hypothetical protein
MNAGVSKSLTHSGGVVSSIVLAAILILLAFFVLKGPSTNDIATNLKLQMENINGQIGSNK